MADGTLAPTERSRLRRLKERGSFDRVVVDAILDEGLVCHVGFSEGPSPFVVPMAYARHGDQLYLHGAAGNRTLKALAAGAPACVTVTLLDGLVLARSAFHHSVNYRSVLIFGTGTRVTDPAEQQVASAALLDHVAPGRSTEARRPTDAELRATAIVRFPIVEGAAKVRTGDPKDDEEDLALGVWAGTVPLRLVAGEPVASADLAPGTAPAPSVHPYPDRRR